MVVLSMLLGCGDSCGVEAARDADGDCVTAASTFPYSGDDTGAEVGEIVVLAKGGDDCASGRWSYLFDPAGGEVVSALLDISGADLDGGRRLEEHPVDVYDTAHFELELALFVVDAGSEQPGVSTAFACDARGGMTWRLRMFDPLDRRSCLLWGADPALLEMEGCARW